MSGHKRVFDENLSGLPDLELVEPDKLGDLKKDLQFDLELPEEAPKESHMRTSEIFVMRQKQRREAQKLKEATDTIVESDVVVENTPLKEDDLKSNIDLEIKEDDPPPKKTRGKRGQDKKPRKKREMTEERKAQLKIAREKSLAVRREKARQKRENKKTKTKPVPIIKEMPKPVAPPVRTPQMSFDYFCDLMDRYEERKKKKVSVSQEPHPNKKIPYQHKPRPPIQKIQRQNVNKPRMQQKRENIKVVQPVDNFSAYSILKKTNKNLFSSGFGF